jgi:putative membrane protein
MDGIASRRLAVVSAGACLALAACAKGDRGARRGAPDASQDSSVKAGVESLAAVNPAFGMSNAEIVATLDAANAADSAGGAMAVRKGRSSDVKAFGRLMMGEHHALRARGQVLAKRLNVTPDATAEQRTRAQGDSAAQRLDGLSGAEFDRAYIDHEVQVHEQVLGTLRKAQGATTNAELKTLLQQAEPVIQKHLDRARQLQRQQART